MTEPTGVRFEGRNLRPTRLRIGLLAGSLLAAVVAGAVAIGASPSPSDQPGSDPGASPRPKQDERGPRWRGGGAFRVLDRLGKAGRGVGFGDITITAITGDQVALRTEDGWTRTITVTDSTPITKAGRSIGRGDLRVGDSVRFAQSRNSDGSFTVTRLAVVLPRVAGEVTATSGNTITVRRRDGTTMTIRVGASTTYRVAGAASGGGLADIDVGMWLVAEGTQNADGSLEAARIAAGERRELKFPFRGPGKHAPGASPAPSASPAATASP